jgi:hypothetical protein
LETAEGAALRSIWDPQYLGHYDGKWIAFRSQFPLSDLPNNLYLQPLLEGFQQDIESGNPPIFAYVTFSEVFI